MMRLCLTILLSSVVLFAGSSARAEDWPGWRGPRGDGTSSEQNLPTRWSATENIAWKVELPGVGHASPIVWQDRIFLVSCLPDSGDRVLMSLDRAPAARCGNRRCSMRRSRTSTS